MSKTAAKRPRSLIGWLYLLVCLTVIASVVSGWLLTGRIIRVHDAIMLAYAYVQRGAGPTWQRIMCVKAWDKAAARATCDKSAALAGIALHG